MPKGKAKKTILLEQEIVSIVEERHPITVRGVGYGLFVRGLIPDMGRNNTNKVSRVMTRMRERGALDWRKVVDDTRRVQQACTWDNPDESIECMVEGYRRDYWQDQPTIIEVWAEKATVQGVLGPVINEYGLPFRVMKGYGSFTSVKMAAQASLSARSQGKDFHVYYVGDWDPSGMQMSEIDLPRRFSEYGGRGEIQRIAVTEQDFDCPSFSAYDKTSDSRFEWFLPRHGDKCWELDAMNPNDLRERVSSYIEASLDLEKWERAIEVEAAEVESMRGFHERWQEIMEASK